VVDTLILDLLDPEEARRPPMAMKDYSDEFKADAVALYESTPRATYNSIAADLGINRATLREWVLRDRERRGGFIHGLWFWLSFRAVATVSDGWACPDGIRSRPKMDGGQFRWADSPGCGRRCPPAEGVVVPGDRGHRGAVGGRGYRERAP
jgi:hypothetical protein